MDTPDPATRLNDALQGRYRIERELGEGGMATVYLADDLKHERKVALKVLKPELAAVVGAERFLAEIKTTANLQHPHILPLHDSGEADSFLFYVMPYVEGETLRERIDRDKQLPVDEAVQITTAVAQALQHAHDRGVIHRDIKPANILMQDGQPVVADFGIALAVGAAGGSRLTETGLSVGTPFYMSPEQATGDQQVGPPSDTYALAAVLYEMLVGEPPYPGNTAQAVLGKIIAGALVSATQIRKSVPANVDAAIRKALEKLPADRFTGAQEFARALADPGFRHGTSLSESGTQEGRTWNRVAVALAGFSVLLAVGLGWSLSRGPTSATPTEPMRLVIQLPDSLRLNGFHIALVPSPNGTRLVLNGRRGIVTRDLASLDAALFLPGRFDDFFGSPDGGWLGFENPSTRQLEKMVVGGGSSVPIVGDISPSFGAAWGPDGQIVYSPGISGGLYRVPAEGGTPEHLTTPDPSAGELAHWRPKFLPGGKKVLFTVYRAPVDSSTIEVLDLETLARTRVLLGGQDAVYVPTGHLVFAYYETLFAVPFDLSDLRVTGPKVPVVSDVGYNQGDALSGFAVSSDGTLAYIRASSYVGESQLVWVSRDGGNENPLRPDWGRYQGASLSPDGTKAAYVQFAADGKSDIWSYDLERAMPFRVTRTDRVVGAPRWSADGSRLFYHHEEVFNFSIYARDWQGSSPEEPVLLGDIDDVPSDVSPDGEVLVFRHGSGDIWTMRLGSDPEPFRVTETRERGAAFSPDGRWIAYHSNETGQNEIWIQSYPDAARGRRQVSAGGGTRPRWSAEGELFYMSTDRMMSVRVDLATGTPGVPIELFGGPYRWAFGSFDVTADGRRFLMTKPRSLDEGREVVVVANWFEELKRLVPN